MTFMHKFKIIFLRQIVKVYFYKSFRDPFIIMVTPF